MIRTLHDVSLAINEIYEQKSDLLRIAFSKDHSGCFTENRQWRVKGGIRETS